MKLMVPFIYQAFVVSLGSRKPRLINLRSETEVFLTKVNESEFPVAFKIKGRDDIHWDGKNLWVLDRHNVYGEEQRVVVFTDVLRNITTNYAGYRFSCFGVDAPFHNFWHLPYGHAGATLRGVNISHERPSMKEVSETLDDIVCREWVCDNREAMVERAHNIASNIRIFDGLMYRPEGEPYYQVVTYGLGNNHGNTALVLDSTFNPKLKGDSFFRVDELREAIEYGTFVARRRGDSNSLPIEGRLLIEILMPDAVQLTPRSGAV